MNKTSSESLPTEYNVYFHATPEGAPDCPAAYYRTQLHDNSLLDLPIQPFPNKRSAIALLMSNETSFDVEQAIIERMFQQIEAIQPEVIVGVPTLGLGYARELAKRLGHKHYVSLGQSRKFWYKEEFSQPASSITSLGTNRYLYIDPGLVARISGKKVLLIDDVITTAGTAKAALQLVTRLGAHPLGIAVALTEGDQWVKTLENFEAGWSDKVTSLGHIPHFKRAGNTWKAQPDRFYTP